MFRKIRDRLFANMSGTLQGQIQFFSLVLRNSDSKQNKFKGTVRRLYMGGPLYRFPLRNTVYFMCFICQVLVAATLKLMVSRIGPKQSTSNGLIVLVRDTIRLNVMDTGILKNLLNRNIKQSYSQALNVSVDPVCKQVNSFKSFTNLAPQRNNCNNVGTIFSSY